MFCSKVAMQSLPNIHLIGMFVMTYTLVFRKKALIPIYIYVMLEGVFYGFTTWWLPYLYVWTILWAVTMLVSKLLSRPVSSNISGDHSSNVSENHSSDISENHPVDHSSNVSGDRSSNISENHLLDHPSNVPDDFSSNATRDFSSDISYKRQDRIGQIVYPCICCLHGLAFGTLFAPVQAIVMGFDFKETIAWIITGFPWDMIHAAGNLVAGFLILPLSKLLKKLTQDKMDLRKH